MNLHTYKLGIYIMKSVLSQYRTEMKMNHFNPLEYISLLFYLYVLHVLNIYSVKINESNIHLYGYIYVLPLIIILFLVYMMILLFPLCLIQKHITYYTFDNSKICI